MLLPHCVTNEELDILHSFMKVCFHSQGNINGGQHVNIEFV